MDLCPKTIFVQNLPDNFTMVEVARMFSHFGEIKVVTLQYVPSDKRLLPVCGWVVFKKAESARLAVETYHTESSLDNYWAPADVSYGYQLFPESDEEDENGGDEEKVRNAKKEGDEEEVWNETLKLNGRGENEQSSKQKFSLADPDCNLQASPDSGQGNDERTDIIKTLEQITNNLRQRHQNAREEYYALLESLRTLRIVRTDEERAAGLKSCHQDLLAAMTVLSCSLHTMVVSVVEHVVSRFRSADQESAYVQLQGKIARRIRAALRASMRPEVEMDYLCVSSGDNMEAFMIPLKCRDGSSLNFEFNGAIAGACHLPSENEGLSSLTQSNRFLNKDVVVPMSDAQIFRIGNTRKWYEGPSKANIVVYNLPTDMTVPQLIKMFETFGRIIAANIYTYSSGLSIGTGFVCFADANSAHRAMRGVNGEMLTRKAISIYRY